MKQTLIALLTLVPLFAVAQSPVSARLSSGYDLGMAYSKNKYNPSITYYQLIHVGERKLLSLGWTARLGAFYGDNLNYYTAPARLTRGKSGLGALTAPLITNNIDTVRYDYITNTSLNIGFRAQLNLGRLEIGGSADLLGIAFGKSRLGRYMSSTGQYKITSSTGADSTTTYFQGANTFQDAKPSTFNVRLLGDNDRGTLATEIYARYRVSQRMGIKLGYQWLTTETTVSNRDVIADNNRFRNRAGMAYFAVTLPVFQ
ncbi:hypothetical protein [Spirosoma fluviale]|uniref:Outer membrane protein beta-barrel domain-containing protein n=1 Tax=Spirosoma fluviale TaxID=1597977 RepID=A0A286F501_9BACT|nr:hypothetical protein [Spirosoma fluviale]SOD78310.1 hypothetical protein SAMN06269250_0398 [Spirosoma fluviale]